MTYDVIVIGSGPAGISASLYLKRANLETLIISKGIGTLEKVEKIENYYGLDKILNGRELQKIGEEQAKKIGIEIKKEEVVQIEYDGKFNVKTLNHEYKAISIIIATGNIKKSLQIKGIKEFEGRGISYCATCDGFFFKGKNVAVLGSKEYAIHEIEELLPIVNSVTMLTNGEKPIEKRLDNVKVEEKKIKEIIGNSKIEKIKFEDDTTKDIDGLFIALGTASGSDLAKKIGINLNKDGRIIVDNNMKTSLDGLYACGDCVENDNFQIAKAVYEGMISAKSVIKYIKDNKNK